MGMEREYEMGKRALWLNKHKHCINEPEISNHSPCVPSSCCFFSFFFHLHVYPPTTAVCLRDANSLSHTCTRTNDFSLSVFFPLLFFLLCLSDVCSMREHRWYTRQHGPCRVYTGCTPILVVYRWCRFQKPILPEKHTFPRAAVGFSQRTIARERVVMATTHNFQKKFKIHICKYVYYLVYCIYSLYLNSDLEHTTTPC